MSLDVSRGKTDRYDRVRRMNRLRKEIVGKGKSADRVKHWRAWEVSSRAILKGRVRLKKGFVRCSGAISTIGLNGRFIQNVRLNVP